MINKLKYLFLLILCVGMMGEISGAYAQNAGGRVLVAGEKPLKQSDIDSLIEFYEWAFETNFTDEQREKFQKYTANEFRSDPAASRKTIDDIVETLPKIRAAAAGVQQKTREIFLAEFLPEARKNTDENSQMLVEIYEAARGVGDSRSNDAANNADETNDSNQAEDASVTDAGDISALVGKWVWGRSGSMTTTTSGVYLGGNGSRHTYQFGSNGTVEYTGIMNVMTGGCKMQIFKTSRGRAALSGNTLTIKWSPASFSRADSCSPAKDYKKTLPAETETLQVKFKTEYGQKQLCLIGKDETCYSPTK